MLTGGSPDIFALGFQEIVPLTAQQIVQADPDKRSALELLITISDLLKRLQTYVGSQDCRYARPAPEQEEQLYPSQESPGKQAFLASSSRILTL